jgi:hypothetical protein
MESPKKPGIIVHIPIHPTKKPKVKVRIRLQPPKRPDLEVPIPPEPQREPEFRVILPLFTFLDMTTWFLVTWTFRPALKYLGNLNISRLHYAPLFV